MRARCFGQTPIRQADFIRLSCLRGAKGFFRMSAPAFFFPFSVFLLLSLLLLTSCGDAGASASAEASFRESAGTGAAASSSSNAGSSASAAAVSGDSASSNAASSAAGTSASGGPYTAPDMVFPVYHAELAQGTATAHIDVSSAAGGYVAAAAASEHRLKFQVLCADATYTYDLPGDGSPAFFPLSCGNGSYHFRIMENVVDSKYAELCSADVEVSLADEFAPFLQPSIYVSYSADSACVKKAADLAQTAGTALGEVAAVYQFVCGSVTYDREKASTVTAGYVPKPDETLSTGRGICFDYAALAASMLRSQGIPTKMVFGYVSPDDLYHAWNMFYTAETGWITVTFEVTPNQWNRLDLTFSANGSDDSFIGDGSNYADVYYY